MVRQNKHRIISGVIAMLFLFCGSAWATAAISTGTDVAFFGDNNVQFTPVPDNLYDLSHDSAYTWGINYQLPQGQYVDTASITFTNINNWKDEPNVLYVNLLDSAPYGVSVANDNEAAGNFLLLLPERMNCSSIMTMMPLLRQHIPTPLIQGS